MIPNLSGDGLQACSGTCEGAETGHERRAAQGTGATYQAFRIGSVRHASKRLQFGQVLIGLEGKKIGAPGWRTHGRAPWINCFISRTAAPIPLVIARLTTLCPMLSSSIAAICATGCTFSYVSP